MRFLRLIKLFGFGTLCCAGIIYAFSQIYTCLLTGSGTFPLGTRILRKILLNGPAVSEPLWLVVALYVLSIPIFIYFLFITIREYR